MTRTGPEQTHTSASFAACVDWLAAQGLRRVPFVGCYVSNDGAAGNIYRRGGTWHAWIRPRFCEPR